MAGKKGKSASRKVKDKWKAKEWYKLYAPRMFNEVEIGETPSADPSTLIGRTTEVTVHDLTGDFSKMHVKLRFKVDDVNGFDARTVFIGHDLTSDYVRRLTRRKRTKTDHVVDVETKDGFRIRVKPMSIAEKRIQSSQESAIREIMRSAIEAKAEEMSVAEMVKDIISGDLAKDIAKACRVVVPIKRVEIRKTEVLEMGTELIPEETVEEPVEVEAEEITETEEELPETEEELPETEETVEEEVVEEEVIEE
jgi:small subunit ribosomal protein S3Ae